MEVRMTTEFDDFRTMDVANRTDDAISQVAAFGRDSLSETPRTFGLITAFGITPIPEPSTLALGLLGLALLSFFRVRQK